MHDVDGLNAGYARLLLDEYLENPEAVPAEWRALFESGEAAVLRTLPGIGLPAGPADGNGARASNGNGPRGAVAEAAPAAEPRRRPPLPPCRSTTLSWRRRIPSCSAASRRRWRSSRRTGCTDTSLRSSTRSGRRRSAILRSTRSGSNRP